MERKLRNRYIYQHRRLDKNEIFYVGIGTHGKKEKYPRANKKSTRSVFWNRITKKTFYQIEIVLDNLTTQEAILKEVELISFYGRHDLGKGTLVNHTDGGEGRFNSYPSNSTKDKMRFAKLGKKQSQETLNKLSNMRKGRKQPSHVIEIVRAQFSKPVLCLNNNYKYTSASEAARCLGLRQTSVSSVARGIRKQTGGYKFKYI